MATLDDEIAAFNSFRDKLEAEHPGEWVIIHNRQLFGTFDSFEHAANVAIRNFGRGPYLIRRIGAAPVPLPVSVLYSLPDGTG